MDAMECLLTRRSVRKYKSDPIPEEVLEEILNAACHAPSAMNMQHWYFVVLRSPEKLAEFKEIMLRVNEKGRVALTQRFPKHPEVVKETESFVATLGGAPVCVLMFLLKEDFPDRGGALQSASAAMENLLLAAWARGIGSCWMSIAQRVGFGPELREHFAPDKGEFVAAVSLGYPDQEPKMPPRREGRYIIL